MDFKQIKELIKLVDDSNISELKIKDGEFNLSLRTAHYNSQSGGNQVSYAQPMMQASAPAQQSSPSPAPSSQSEAPKADSQGGDTSAAEDENANFKEFKSPMIGTFYRKPGPEDEIFCKVGDSVKSGDVVCIIEAMKLFNEIEFEGEGKIVKFLVEDSQPVEYDQPLFLYEPA